MKLGRIRPQSAQHSSARVVAVIPEEQIVVDLALAEVTRLQKRGASPDAALRSATATYPGSLRACIELGDEFIERAQESVAQADERSRFAIETCDWLPAIDPLVVRDFLAFEQHMKNSASKVGLQVPDLYYEIPCYYKGNPTGLIGHDAIIPWPPYGDYLDYELELGFVIGRSGRNLTPDEAASTVYGVTIFNDFSIRDYQRKEMSLFLGPAKSKDFATAVGPWIVTNDEIDLTQLMMGARVNGVEWSSGSSATMMWSPWELIAYASYGETVNPGDLIGSGTVGGGCGLELDRRLAPGDVVELEVSGVGILRNVVGHPEEKRWEPQRRKRS